MKRFTMLFIFLIGMISLTVTGATITNQEQKQKTEFQEVFQEASVQLNDVFGFGFEFKKSNYTFVEFKTKSLNYCLDSKATISGNYTSLGFEVIWQDIFDNKYDHYNFNSPKENIRSLYQPPLLE